MAGLRAPRRPRACPTRNVQLAAEAELFAFETGIFAGLADEGKYGHDDLCGEED